MATHKHFFQEISDDGKECKCGAAIVQGTYYNPDGSNHPVTDEEIEQAFLGGFGHEVSHQ